jgi:DNA polymerase-3 subunit gamma/tau
MWLIKLPPYLGISMSYIALARKWRPRIFEELIGQEHVNKILINSLTQKRLHHAYLFTGTRGVGKTSVARLFAKAMNCELGISANPCLQCAACISIEQGSFVDLIEVDAASRTRVEDTRELLENVQYLPTMGRFKIYLIDEVHMLSQHSFNALLKTLEEPPDHVKFLLATTDPQKLPITVLSRCLQFHLQALSIEIIVQQLVLILQQEKLNYEELAVKLLAEAAHGSMRDALSLLDQAIAISNNNITLNVIRDMLGYTQQDYALLILQALSQYNPQKLIQISGNIAKSGGQFNYVLTEILNYLHKISIYQNIQDEQNIINNMDLVALSKKLLIEDVQLFYQIGLKSIEDLALAPNLAIGFEMMLLRMYTFMPKITSPILDNLDNNDILENLKLNGLAKHAIEHVVFISKDNVKIQLQADPIHKTIFTPAICDQIEQELSNYYQEKLKMEIIYNVTKKKSLAQKREDAKNMVLQNDQFFQQLQQEFNLK